MRICEFQAALLYEAPSQNSFMVYQSPFLLQLPKYRCTANHQKLGARKCDSQTSRRQGVIDKSMTVARHDNIGIERLQALINRCRSPGHLAERAPRSTLRR